MAYRDYHSGMTKDTRKSQSAANESAISAKPLTLRARGLEPRANYVIKPAAGSLVGDVPSLRDDPERANAVVARMLENSGARRRASPNKHD